MTTRRSLLAYFALPAALTACHPAVPAFHPRFAADHPDAELLKLGADLDAAVVLYRNAEDALNAAVARCEAVEPPIPQELVLRSFNGWIETQWPPDALGVPNSQRKGNRVCIPSRYDLDRKVKDLDGRTVLGRRVRYLKKLSDTFHAAHATAREEAGVPTAQRNLYDRSRALSDLIDRIGAISASTTAGLAAKGRSELAWARLWYSESRIQTRPNLIALLENMAVFGGGMGGVA